MSATVQDRAPTPAAAAAPASAASKAPAPAARAPQGSGYAEQAAALEPGQAAALQRPPLNPAGPAALAASRAAASPTRSAPVSIEILGESTKLSGLGVSELWQRYDGRFVAYERTDRMNDVRGAELDLAESGAMDPTSLDAGALRESLERPAPTEVSVRFYKTAVGEGVEISGPAGTVVLEFNEADWKSWDDLMKALDQVVGAIGQQIDAAPPLPPAAPAKARPGKRSKRKAKPKAPAAPQTQPGDLVS